MRGIKSLLCIFSMFLPIYGYTDPIFDEQFVILPADVKQVLELLKTHAIIQEVPSKTILSRSSAHDMVSDALFMLHNHEDDLTPDQFRIAQAYLEEYEKYIDLPESWITDSESFEDDNTISRRAHPAEYQVLLDVWVQHSLRAQLLTVDTNATINGFLNVGGSAYISDNLSVGNNVNIGGTLTVNGPAYFEDVFIGGPSGCTGGSGLLEVCGTLTINGISITGPLGPQGATGPAGATGPQGSAGPQGPPGFLGATAPSLILVDTTNSNSCNSGTLIVAGGMGVGGNLNVCGYINTFTDYELNSMVILNATGTNLALGFSAANPTQGSGNTVVGNQAGAAITNSATSNTIMGSAAADALSSGSNNVVIGAQAGQALTSGSDNTWVGYLAGQSAAAASAENTFVGTQAGQSLSGNENVVIGQSAGTSTSSTVSQSVFIGYGAGASSQGTNNTFIGYQSGQSNNGSNNTALGAGTSINSGISNATAIGTSAAAITSNAIQLGTSATSVYVSTDQGGGSLYLPTVGGTPSALNYYEEDTISVTWNWGANQTTANVTFMRIGNIVIVSMAQIQWASISGASIITSNTLTIPTRFLPANANPSIICAVVFYSTDFFYPAYIGITNVNRQFSLSQIVNNQNITQFPDPSGATVTVSPFSFSYTV